MAVLPAKYQVDLGRLKAAADKDSAELAAEPEFADVFPGCDTGAMPPFGNLFDIPVWVDETLASDEEIAFNAGSYSELIQLSYKDFEALVRPERATIPKNKVLSKIVHRMHRMFHGVGSNSPVNRRLIPHSGQPVEQRLNEKAGIRFPGLFTVAARHKVGRRDISVF